jgi:hypothetical protein
MTVGELKTFLTQFRDDLPIVFAMHSEYKVLTAADIGVECLQPARADGWVHLKWYGEPAVPTIEYLVFPGN